MKEADKGWFKSKKLNALMAAGLVIIVILATHFYDEAVLLAVLDIAKYIITATIVSRSALTGFQNYAYQPPANFVPSTTPQEETK